MDAGIGHNAIPLADRLDLDHEDLRDEISAALEALPDDLNITSDTDILRARDLVVPLKALQARAAAAFKAEKQPYLDAARQVDSWYKRIRVALDATVGAITANVSAYQEQKLAAAREQAASEARIAAMLDEPAPAAPAPAAATRVADNGAVAVSGAVRWDFEITDADALPRELLQPNEAAIRARVAGLKATVKIDEARIPGVRIFEKISTVFR